MSLPVFNPKNDIQAPNSVVVRIMKFGEAKDGQWGNFYPDAEVSIDGTTHAWNLSGKKKEELDKLGFKEGDLVEIEKWKQGEKSGYNFKATTRNPYKEAKQVFQDLPITDKFEPPKDAVQERILKGMCFNNACTLLAKETTLKEGDTLALSKFLYDEMSEWLTS